MIWLDAHGDFNTPAISASGYLAGMSLAMLTGRAPELICEGLGLRPVPDEQAVLIDGRDLDPAERDALEASRVQRLAADPGAIRSALNDLPLAAVYLHVDVDIIDSEDLPGLRFPTDDGPSFSVVEECLAQIAAAAPPIAASIACAWASDRIGDESTRRAITRLAGAIGAELHWPVDDARWVGDGRPHIAAAHQRFVAASAHAHPMRADRVDSNAMKSDCPATTRKPTSIATVAVCGS